MQVKIDGHDTVRDVVVTYPAARRIFEGMGIDYCCGGQKPLSEAAKNAGVSVSEVASAVEHAVEEDADKGGEPDRSWTDASLTELADHIETAHHAYMRDALPRLSKLLTTVGRAHHANHGEMLAELSETFGGLREEIEMHLMKEEQVLFPYIRQMQASASRKAALPPMHCGTVQNPVRQMEAEHEHAGDALARMRSLTDDYTLPADACPTFEALYQALQELEADLHEHIHLENNILFPRAERLESELRTTV